MHWEVIQMEFDVSFSEVKVTPLHNTRNLKKQQQSNKP